MRGIVKLLIVVAVIYIAWHVGGPWIQKQMRSSSSSTSSAVSASMACVDDAARASEAWDNGIGRFVNPPVDQAAWSSFRSSVQDRISSSQAKCGCSDESCGKVRDALDRLSSLVSDLDLSVGTGSPPPSDLAQRQQSVDDELDSARHMAKLGY